MDHIYLIKYGELGLKGKNKNFFLNKLVENIKKSADIHKLKLEKLENKRDRIIVDFDASEKEAVECLRKVFGIKYFVRADIIEPNIESIENYARGVFVKWKKDGIERISLKINRANKAFPFKSPEIGAKIGEVANQEGLKIDFARGEKTLFVDVAMDGVYCYTEKIAGAGGLPTGTGGRALCLFSGGIDSPVAAYALMRRGVQVDFLHIHPFADNEKVTGTKIESLINTLNKYQYQSKLFLAPYIIFEQATIGNVASRFEMPFFKHMILYLADKLAQEHGYDALITGDSLGQVASQTMENMKSASLDIKTPIFRPLIGDDKEGIIKIAEQINTYEDSIAQYRDCCSLVSDHPATKTKESDMRDIFEKIDRDELAEKMTREMKIYPVRNRK
ncbi:tRNA uracil 4-sulfurtransferase ThiI [Patescibacteria group bacterium]